MSNFVEGEPGAQRVRVAGWTIYAPLSTSGITDPAVDSRFCRSILPALRTISAPSTSHTIFKHARAGMTMHKMPLFVWSIMGDGFCALMLTVGSPDGITRLYDRNFGTTSFSADRRRRSECCSAWFWFFCHPIGKS